MLKHAKICLDQNLCDGVVPRERETGASHHGAVINQDYEKEKKKKKEKRKKPKQAIRLSYLWLLIGPWAL